MSSTESGDIPIRVLPENERTRELREVFAARYKKRPDFFIRVPGRVNLIGEHVDYCGYSVCPMALEQDILLAISTEDDKMLHLHNFDPKFDDFQCDLSNFEITSGEGPPQWHQYFICGVKGVIEVLPKDVVPKGMKIVVSGTVPQSAGLSSSSALVSAAALATSHANKNPMSKEKMANLCAECERYIGTQGGGMDQAIAFLASEVNMPKADHVTKVTKVRHVKFQYSPAKVELALNAVNEGMAVATASRTFNVPRTTLRNKISGKSRRESRHCGFVSHLGNEIESQLVEWILTCAKMGFPIDKDGLLCSVQKLVREANIRTPFVNDRPGKKWYYSFMSRHKELSQKKAEYIHGGRGAVTEDKIRKWFDEIKGILSEINAVSVLKDPQRIFNMDETCFCLAPKTGLVIGPRGKHIYDERSSSDKENVTTLFTVNAVGNFAPPLTIFKYDRIPSGVAKSAPEGWGLGKSEKGWMTAECFFEYFSNVFVPFLKKSNFQFPVLVFLDGHKSHLTLHLSRYCRENQVILVALVPNATHILQPLDVTVFGPLKSKWKNFVRKYKMENNGQEITKSSIPNALSQLIQDPKMLSNIISGFKATGLYPFSADNIDYSKIILRKCDEYQTRVIDPAAIDHLKYVETKIDPILLEEFKQTNKRNHEWEGKIEAAYLYNVWLELSKDAENSQPTELQEEEPDTNDVRNNLSGLSTPTQSKNDEDRVLEPKLTSLSTPDENIMSDVLPSTSSCLPLTPVDTLLNDNNSTVVNNFHPKNVDQVKRNILITPKSLCSSIFHDVVPYPETKVIDSTKKRKKDYIPSVITSDKWVQYHAEIERVKKETEQKKLERKQARELNKLSRRRLRSRRERVKQKN